MSGDRCGGLPMSVAENYGLRGMVGSREQRTELRDERSFASAYELHRQRVVASTDAVAGLSLSHELELYVRAGIPAADVLALATLGAARVMGLDREAGSIAVGKRADLVLLDGDPTRDITAVRNTRSVVCRGLVYDPAELFGAISMRP
jgi:imidazolonepropionase-like amidohydrolase